MEDGLRGTTGDSHGINLKFHQTCNKEDANKSSQLWFIRKKDQTSPSVPSLKGPKDFEDPP